MYIVLIVHPLVDTMAHLIVGEEEEGIMDHLITTISIEIHQWKLLNHIKSLLERIGIPIYLTTTDSIR